ncbi:MAG: hypothetical protein EOP44_01015 [Sphingobacteriaceae bacterium]|nr:MAG: hypothetical protein EOP44_01015 [Sphingobacteriaceae bacterium]
MTKALITCAQHPGVYFLEKWFSGFNFVYGDTVFTNQISASQQLLLPKVSEADFIHQLLNICLDNQINTVFAMSFLEQKLLAEAVELFSEFEIQLHLPDLNSRKLLFDQTQILQKLHFNGIKTVSHQTTNSFAGFSKACLQLGYPTENISVSSAQNPDLIWIIDDQHKADFLDGKPVIPFTKAAKLFAAEDLLLLRKFDPSTQKIVYASFTDGNLESVWNPFLSEEINKIGAVLKLNGLFEIEFQQEEIFNLKSFFVR